MSFIRHADTGDIPALYEFYERIGKKDNGYFEEAFTRADLFVVEEDGKLCAFCLLNWSPRYSFYKKLGIPEIQDINVAPDFRRRGIATALISHCERLAQEKFCDYMGISVGLTKDYGPAQILYAKIGYIPDGNGVTCDREAVTSGRLYRMDDDLALMMVKAL